MNQQLVISTVLEMQDYHMITSCKCLFFHLCSNTDLVSYLRKVQMATVHSSRFIVQLRNIQLRTLLIPGSMELVNVHSSIPFLVVMLQNIAHDHRCGWTFWNGLSIGNGTTCNFSSCLHLLITVVLKPLLCEQIMIHFDTLLNIWCLIF